MINDFVLLPIAAALNHQARLSEKAQPLLTTLEGKTLKLDVENYAISFFLGVKNGAIELRRFQPNRATIEVSAASQTLLEFLRSGDVEFSVRGNLQSLHEFRDLLITVKPDLEEQLSRLLGQEFSFPLAQVLLGIPSFAMGIAARSGQQFEEYAQEESRVLPANAEVDDFKRRLATLKTSITSLKTRLENVTKT